jgi:hypothetical protein
MLVRDKYSNQKDAIMPSYECSCGVKGKENFYSNARYQCKKCWNKRTYQSGIDKINKIKKDYGGSCSKCGYNKSFAALEFHHLDPTIKEYSLSQRRGLKEEILKIELSKCILVCANCHREIHSN